MNNGGKFTRNLDVADTQVLAQPGSHIAYRQLNRIDRFANAGGPIHFGKGHRFIAVDDDGAERNRRQTQDEPQEKDAANSREHAQPPSPPQAALLLSLLLLQILRFSSGNALQRFCRHRRLPVVIDGIYGLRICVKASEPSGFICTRTVHIVI